MEKTSWKKSSKSRVAGFAKVNLTHRQDHPADGIVKASMKKLAELHANGFSHGHPNRHNLLVENAGVVRLIDPKDITRLYRIGKKSAEQLRLKDRNALAEHVLEMLDDRKEFKDAELDAFSNQLDEQYIEHYQACLERLKEQKP